MCKSLKNLRKIKLFMQQSFRKKNLVFKDEEIPKIFKIVFYLQINEKSNLKKNKIFMLQKGKKICGKTKNAFHE